MYRKEIIYVGLHKDGNRLGTAGFLKVENRGNESGLYLKIKNIPHSVKGRFPVRFYNGTDWQEVDGITLQEGGGQWEKREPGSLQQVRLQIMLPSGYLIEGMSKEAEQPEKRTGQPEKSVAQPGERIGQPEEKAERRLEKDTEQPIERRPEKDTEQPTERRQEGDTGKPAGQWQERGREKPAEQRREGGREKLSGQRPEGDAAPEAERIPVQKQRTVIRDKTADVIDRMANMVSEELPSPMADEMQLEGVKEDKWEQILNTYDRIYPYGDERVYVKLQPKDFVILQAKYQPLVNNSFLLHGFYNYRYVILGKEKDYYLGVPGVYYEREKMVALMFGFEAFECRSGEAKPGEFGYYLRRVEL